MLWLKADKVNNKTLKIQGFNGRFPFVLRQIWGGN